MEEKNLAPYLLNQKILHDLCLQLTKDIALEGFEVQIPFPVSTAFEHLFHQLFPLIQNMEKENKAKLNMILYRTDISEMQLKNRIKREKEKSFAQLLTELIIKRELQKVVIRNMHK